MLRLHFHGAAQGVTGSCFLLEAGGARLLLDCGLFQGSKTEKELNYRPFPFRPAALDAMVERALDGLPAELARLVDNVVVLVEPEAPADDPDLLGLYDGLALTERPANHAGMLPDRILLFRGSLLDMADTCVHLEEEVRITVVHEVAHHFGLDDRRLHELGWG